MRLIEFLDRLDEKRPPQEMYHGTSTEFLREILKKGIVPDPKQKRWDVDPDASAMNLSRASLGGSYWTTNLMTARSSAWSTKTKFGGNQLTIIALIAEGSAFADEDSINFDLMRAPAATYAELFGQGITQEAAPLLLAGTYWATQDAWTDIMSRIPGSRLREMGISYEDVERGVNLQDMIVETFSRILHEHLAADPQRQPVNKNLMKAILESMLLRALAYEAKSYEKSYSRSPHLGNFESMQEKGVAPELPSLEEAEQQMLQLRDQLTRIYTKTAYKDSGGFSHTLRTTEPVTYRGSNRIIGIIEELDDYNAPLILHYGKITQSFLEMYRERVGAFPGAVNAQGQMVMQPDAKAVNESRLNELVDVQTPAFKQWFGNSKVVNEDGSPMMVFHGTDTQTEFTELQGMSHFGSKEAAQAIIGLSKRGGPQRIFPAYLKIENPLEIEDTQDQHDSEFWLEYLTTAGVMEEDEVQMVIDSWDEEGWMGRDADDPWAEIEFTPEHEGERLQYLGHILKGYGYDGIHYINRYENEGSHAWVIFDPSQVKYAYAESRLDELYTPDVTYLKKYLAGDSKDIDIYSVWGSHSMVDPSVTDWLEEHYPQLLQKMMQEVGTDNPDEIEPDEFYSLPQEIQQAYIEEIWEEYIYTMMTHDPANTPSQAFYSDIQLLDRQTWLVHFSDDAMNIARDGFKYGMDQMDKLGLTTYFKDTGFDKGRGGYNFAFEAGSRWANNAARQGKYGTDVVMFTNAGVKAWHSGDEEDQVMFWGANVDPRSIILISKSDDYTMHEGWCVSQHPSKGRFERDCVYQNEDFDTVTNWVEQNWRQYAKIITGW